MNVFQEIQPMIDENPYVSGAANDNNTLQSSLYVLYVSEGGMKHILDRHADEYAPGSTLTQGFDFLAELEDIITEPGQHDSRGMVKWMELDLGKPVGAMGVEHADPEKVAQMRDYIMPTGNSEKVKVAGGTRKPTSLLSVITAKIGELPDGRDVLSLVTMFPGANTINGVEMPYDRNAFAASGFYFVLPEDSPMI